MHTITFVVHTEWIKKEDPEIYIDPCATLRVCVTHLQFERPDLKLSLQQSDAKMMTVMVAAELSREFVTMLYKLAGELIRHDAKKWLRISEYALLHTMPELAEPVGVKPDREQTEVVLEGLCRHSLMQEYPMLADCLRTQAGMICKLREMGLTHCAWEQNLLVAMDDDADFDEFVAALYQLYKLEGLVTPGKNAPGTTIHTVTTWELAASAARGIAKEQDMQDRKEILLIVDVRQAGYVPHSKEMRRALQSISGLHKKFLCIFRTQVLEMDLIERMIDDINDAMPVRAVVAPPVGTDVLRKSFQSKLRKCGFALEENCDGLIEQWIVQESNAGGFAGQELTRRMVRELILHKVQKNVEADTTDRIITANDIRQCMHCAETAAPVNAREKLDALVGVAEIKQKVLEIAAQIKVHEELDLQGVEKPALHMMFMGNPGTGKTAVARIIAEILREEGILSKGHLYEVTARELCGQHIGETAPKVIARCKDAYGSVLFVDEAYALYKEDSPRDFGQEALTTLMTEMENHRDDFCVILAGYPKEMEQLMTANPGLRSRIPYTIRFPNFSREELNAIFFQMIEGHFAYDESLIQAAKEFFDSIPQEIMESPAFSNARMVRNLYERVWGKAAYRKMLNKEEQLVLRGEDLAAAVAEQDFKRLIEMPGKKRPIGFVI